MSAKRFVVLRAALPIGVLAMLVLIPALGLAADDGLRRLSAEEMGRVRGAASCCKKPSWQIYPDYCQPIPCVSQIVYDACGPGQDAYSWLRVPSDHKHCAWCLRHDGSPCPTMPYRWECAYYVYYYSNNCAVGTELCSYSGNIFNACNQP